jgi:hypothetical protein
MTVGPGYCLLYTQHGKAAQGGQTFIPVTHKGGHDQTFVLRGRALVDARVRSNEVLLVT